MSILFKKGCLLFRVYPPVIDQYIYLVLLVSFMQVSF